MDRLHLSMRYFAEAFHTFANDRFATRSTGVRWSRGPCSRSSYGERVGGCIGHHRFRSVAVRALHFPLTNLLLPKLRETAVAAGSPPSRVITVSSSLHRNACRSIVVGGSTGPRQGRRRRSQSLIRRYQQEQKCHQEVSNRGPKHASKREKEE
jgi:hypothetical protein